MTSKCLVCFSTSTECVAYFINDNIQFPSGKRLLDIFTKIFDVTTQEIVTQKYSQVICRKCLISFVEFDELHSQLTKLKSSLKLQYQTSYKRFILGEARKRSPGKSAVKVVHYSTVMEKCGLSPNNVIAATSDNEPIPTTSTQTEPIVIDAATLSQLMKFTSGRQPPILTLDGLSQSVTITHGDSQGNATLGYVKLKPGAEVGDSGMDAEKDCGYTIISRAHTQDTEQGDMSPENSSKGPLECDEGVDKGGNKYVIDKVEIVDEDEDAETIMMEGEDGSVIKMVGKDLYYGDRQISLVLPPDSTDGDNYDNNDSNDESQIELQMSGDEDTANAIIAATKEQGGAFIKINSGEMYRVEAVKSSAVKIEDINMEDIMDVNDTQTGYTCLLCKKTEDEDTHSDSAPRPDVVFTSTGAISHHLSSLHKLYVCVSCKAITDDVTKHKKHMLTHDKTKGKYQCNVCFKRFFSQNLLSQHMNFHSGSKPFSCSYCDKSFASKYTCQTHMKIHQERPRPFQCKTCNKSFLTAQNLNQHIKIHEGIKDHICTVCGKGFAAKHNLDVHSVVHSGEKPFLCGVCNKGFARKQEIRDHIRTHTGERPFSCEICGAAFSQRSNLLSHKRATHLDDRRYKCDQCDKRFKRRRLLVYHIKSTHTGERPFTCGECRATFVYPEHYKKHMKIHTGVRPYTCEVCGKSFNSRDNRNAHRFTHSDKKPYECLVCGAGFMRKPLLYLHMNAQNHISESIVVNEPQVLTDTAADQDTKVQFFEAVNEQEFQAVNSNGEDVNLLEAADLTSVEELDKNTVNIDASFLDNATLQNIVAQDKVLSEDGSEAVVRLVQVQLPNGNNGWIALDQ